MAHTIQRPNIKYLKRCPKCRGVGKREVIEKTYKFHFGVVFFVTIILFIITGHFMLSFLFGLMMAVMLISGYERVPIWKCSRCKGVGAIFPRQIIERIDGIEPIIIY